MVLFAIIISLLLSNSILAQEVVDPDIQTSESILETERLLDREIVRLNKRLTYHSKLLRLKVKILPTRTVLYKGVTNGNKCDLANDQEAPENNCIHLEVYDFLDSDNGLSKKSVGSKNKAMILFFAGNASDEKDPRKVPPRELNKIYTKVYFEDFRVNTRVYSEINDEAPSIDPLDNKNYFLFYQVDGYPLSGTVETPSEKGVGRYSLEVVDNSISHDIRNTFKKKFYFKHMDYFDKLYTKIFSFNNKGGSREYRKNIQVLQNSLEY